MQILRPYELAGKGEPGGPGPGELEGEMKNETLLTILALISGALFGLLFACEFGLPLVRLAVRAIMRKKYPASLRRNQENIDLE